MKYTNTLFQFDMSYIGNTATSPIPNMTSTEGVPQIAYCSQLDRQFMANLNKYIATNIENESLTIDDLTHQCAMSRSQLFRKIKALTHKTPALLIRDYRLDIAHLLFQTDKTRRVSEVMFAVGFNDAKHFGQIFKQRFGITPQAMKKSKLDPDT